MAVLPMAKVNIYGLKSERKGVLEALQRFGVVDVSEFDVSDGMERPDTSGSQSRFNKAKADAEQALEILNRYSPEEKSMFAFLEGKDKLSKSRAEELIGNRDKILGYAAGILKLDKSISELKGENLKLENGILALSPWEGLQVPINYRGTKKTAAFIGAFPDSRDENSILHEISELCIDKGCDELAENIHLEIVSVRQTQTCAFLLCARKDAQRLEEILRLTGFAAPTAVYNGIPSEKIQELKKLISDNRAKISENEQELIKNSVHRSELKFIVDYFTMRTDKYKVISKLGQTKSVFALTGYAPERDIRKLEEAVGEKFSIVIETEKAEGDDVPVLLDNGGFAAPLEGVLETFSLPGKGEFDPTAAMAVFYYFLFGLMLSDAAYGFIMVLVCAVALLKFPNMNDGMKRSLKMYLYCGISTTFWGVMFGGYFGDAIQVISSTFFKKEIIVPPLWFSPIENPMKMLMFSFAIGIIHLFTGLGMKLYALVKEKQYKDALYDVIFWYLLVGGGIVYLLSMPMFISMSGLSFILPKAAGTGAAITAGIGAAGIALTGGRSSKNPFKRLAKGLYELYNVTGYLSDILSYSRLLALGLATGVIANVFNKMGSMMGDGVIGAILFTIIFVIGHTLNIGINLLGAYVHTNRLQFVEFFGKFYEGGGRKYAPFKAETAYFEVEKN